MHIIWTLFLEQKLVNDFSTIIQLIQGDITAQQATPPFIDCTLTLPVIKALRNVSRNSRYIYILYFSPLLR